MKAIKYIDKILNEAQVRGSNADLIAEIKPLWKKVHVDKNASPTEADRLAELFAALDDRHIDYEIIKDKELVVHDTNMPMTKDEINDYLDQHDWRGYGIDFSGNTRETDKWNEFDTPEKAFLNFIKKRDAIARSSAAEFQSRHSALSPSGADAYADNWN